MCLLQMLRVRFTKDDAASDPMQHIAPLGSPSECLATVYLEPQATSDISKSDGVCHILPGAVFNPLKPRHVPVVIWVYLKSNTH